MSALETAQAAAKFYDPLSTDTQRGYQQHEVAWHDGMLQAAIAQAEALERIAAVLERLAPTGENDRLRIDAYVEGVVYGTR